MLDVLYPDEINGPRVPAEIVPEVEQFDQVEEDDWFGVARIGCRRSTPPAQLRSTKMMSIRMSIGVVAGT